MKVLVTGANGFIGRSLVDALRSRNINFVLTTREGGDVSNEPSIRTGDLSVFDGWMDCLDGIDVIVHLASQAGYCADTSIDAYMGNNIQIIRRMLISAKSKGVKRFIFISSIKVNGETTKAMPFQHSHKSLPEDLYSLSKMVSEQLLYETSAKSDLEVVVIRPPLVYGPGVKANFQRLLSLAGLPLPFASINNRRDMVSVYNLCDLIVTCIDHPEAKNQTFLVSDGRSHSLAELLSTINHVQGRRSWLWSFPVPCLSLILKLLGKRVFAQRLLGNLEIDISHTTATLDWYPRYTLENTLRKMQL